MNKIIVDENALNNVLENPEQRKLAYKIYTIVGILLGATQVFFSTTGYDFVWFEALIGVYLFLSIPFAGLALKNTPAENQTEILIEDTNISE